MENIKAILKSKNTTPPGGWRYEQPETGAVLHGSSWSSLIKEVEKHRVQNGIKTAGLEGDIETFLCSILPPSMCQFTQPKKTSKKTVGIRDVADFVNAVKDTLYNGGVVEEEKARKRAEICARCPLNVSIPGCYGCKGIANTVMSLLGSKTHGQEGVIKQCGACGCYLDAKVWVPYKKQPATINEYPPHCWMVNEK
jgi:hypothetical protein